MIHQFRTIMLFACAFGVLTFGCDKDPAKPLPRNREPGVRERPAPRTINKTKVDPKHFRDHWAKSERSKRTKGVFIEPLKNRNARRLSTAHMRKIIPRLFPGLNWTSDYRAGKGSNMFSRLSITLGQADYLFSTENTRRATSLFMKFMDDMAGNVCRKAVAADKEEKDLNKKMLVLTPRDVDGNLRFLRLKFHTVYVAPDSRKEIRGLRLLFDKVLIATQSQDKAWAAVCVAMLTDPEFFVY